MGIINKLFDRIRGHSTAPYNCLIGIDEETDGEHLNAKLFDGFDKRSSFDFNGERSTIFGMEHLGHRWSVNIGVEKSDAIAFLRQGDSQIGCDG